MKTHFFVTAAVIAGLATPASAQVLGGRLGGGLGGNLGGSLGGTSGGLSGSLDGNLDRDAVRTPRTPPRPAVRAPAARPLANASVAVGAVTAAAPRAVVVAPPPVVVRSGPAYGYGYAYDGPTYVEREAAPPPPPPQAPDVYMDRQYEDLRGEMQNRGVEVHRRGRDVVVEMPADITFGFNKSDLQPRFMPTLAAVARQLNRYDQGSVEVIGHTDAIGSDAYNDALSLRRANTVADFLADHAVEPDRLRIAGLGKTEPVASNATIAGRAANRRVELVLHAPDRADLR